MRAEGHHHLFERGVAGAFADAVDGHFGLTGTVDHTGYGVGRGHSEVVVAVGGNDHLVDALHVVDQIFDLGTEFRGEAVAGGVGDVYDCGTGADNGFDHAGEIFIVGASGVFGVKLHVFHEFLGEGHGSDSAFENVVAGGVEFIFDVVVRGADTGVDAGAFGIFQRFGGHADVVFDSAGQRADCRPCDCF